MASSPPDTRSSDTQLSPDSLQPAGGRGGARRSGGHRRRLTHPVMQWIAMIGGSTFALLAIFLMFSVVGALRTGGNHSFKTKWVNWLRSHDAQVFVSQSEGIYLKANTPKRGGSITGSSTVPTVEKLQPQAGPASGIVPHLARPTDISLLLPALPGIPEGQWQPTGPMIDGVSGMYVSRFRADTTYTNQVASAVWIDPMLLHLSLIPGYKEPGGLWDQPHYIEGATLAKIAAAFNGGFRFKDAHGGFYLNGRTEIPLVDGAASMVIYGDGHVDIGKWGAEVGMTPQVEGVLQNLTLMVDQGTLDPQIDQTSLWGATIGGKLAVARSGIGVTKDGALLYVAGPILTAKSLAESLRRAGAVRAMTLDINPEWVTFNLYEHQNATNPSDVRGVPLFPEQNRPGSRYLSPEARDFIAISTY